jgi:hypothetical protein
MKKTVLALALFLSIGLRAWPQYAVTAPILESIMSVTHADQVVYYAQSLYQLVESAVTAYNHFQNALRMEERALQNLRGVTEVKTWDDLVAWHNRQLYLERQAENMFMDMSVKIGGRSYSIEDIENIPEAAGSAYIDYWDNDFSAAQRREMWLNLGLTPSNYVYTQAWKQREMKLAKNILTKLGVVNQENMASAERSAEILDSLAEDKLKDEKQKMGEKDLLSYILEMLIDTNRAIRQAAYDQAEKNEHELAQQRLEAVPPGPPVISESAAASMFAPLP